MSMFALWWEKSVFTSVFLCLCWNVTLCESLTPFGGFEGYTVRETLIQLIGTRSQTSFDNILELQTVDYHLVNKGIGFIGGDGCRQSPDRRV